MVVLFDRFLPGSLNWN